MSIFREIPPTAGFPISIKDYLYLISKGNKQGSLEQDFKDYLGVPYARITYSGTAAFYLILESLKEISAKKTVIIPAFICPLLPLAIKRAGLKVLVCDINKNNFNFDTAQLKDICQENSDILAIVAVHLAGIPLDFLKIKQAASENKIFIIEDCAQALGAEYQSQKVGTLGDFAFFSLCRGKGLTIYEGGVLVSKENKYTAIIDDKIERLIKVDLFSETLKILELFGYGIVYRPQLFWFVFRLPQMFWKWRGQTLKALSEYFTIDFPMHKVSRIRKLIGHATFGHLESQINAQRKKAGIYRLALKDTAGINFIAEPPETKSTFPFMTLVFNDPEKRNSAFSKLESLRLGISQIYASSITDYNYLKDVTGAQVFINARYLAQRHLTLSTSVFLKPDDLDSVIKALNQL